MAISTHYSPANYKINQSNLTHLDNKSTWVEYEIDSLKFGLGWVKPIGYPTQPKCVSKLRSFMKAVNMNFINFCKNYKIPPKNFKIYKNVPNP